MNKLSLAVLFFWTGLAGAAEWGQFEREFDAEAKPWQELQIQLPTAYKTDALHEFRVDGGKGHRYFIDPESLTAGEDGVVRYTLVIRTAGGAENVNYEGLRCATGERKLYAFGRPDGQWSRNQSARWMPIDARGVGSYQKELFFHYLCTVDTVGDIKAIRNALRVGGIRRGGD